MEMQRSELQPETYEGEGEGRMIRSRITSSPGLKIDLLYKMGHSFFLYSMQKMHQPIRVEYWGKLDQRQFLF